MRCFEHINREAIGTCVECGKGICLDCLYKIDNKIFCSGCSPSSHRALSSINRQVQQLAQPRSTPHYGTGTLVTTHRKREVAAILAFLLGSIGGHKFYLGEYGWGILYFLFSWTGIPTLAGWVEALMYIARSEQDFIRRYGTPVLSHQSIHPQTSLGASLQPELGGQRSLRSGRGQARDYERILLEFAQRHDGTISLALLMSETEINLDKAEEALAKLSARGVVQAQMDDNGRTTYYVPEFRHRLEDNS